MNITFLIGNGFDVGLGMKSRFQDFFPYYKESSQSKPARIKQLSNSIEDNYETWADFEKALGEYTSQFNLDNKQDFIDQVKDFETEFIAYLKRQESTLSFKDSERIANVMVNGLTQYYSLNNLAAVSNAAISEIYKKFNCDNHVFNFVNFNYTSLLSKSLQTISQGVVCKRKYGGEERTDKIGKIIHVHGYYNKQPIIGVNDKRQIAHKELAEDSRFARYILKPSMNLYLRNGNDRDTTNVINNSTIICVYGMSLSITDTKWWDLLILWLNGNSNRQLVLFEYDDKYTPTTPYGWLEKEDYIIDKLEKYNSNKSIQVEDLRSRIHIAIHKNIFQMSLQPKKESAYRTNIGQLVAATKYVTEHPDEIAAAQKDAELLGSLIK